jgi:radical SAM protein with 4Fe4S-binding SPASM domain
MAITLYFQGEPFINKQLFDFVQMARQKKLYTITSTNGHFLNENNCEQIIQSGLDKLIVSIDGLTQETYSKYRIEGDLDTVLKGMKRLAELKKKLGKKHPQIVAQFIVFKHNQHELKHAHQLLKFHGADRIQVKTAQIYHEAQAAALLPDDPSLSRYELGQDGKLKIRNKLLNHCWRMWSTCVITWDGHVVPCCFDKDASYKVGNINHTDDFRQIMHTPEYMAFRKSLLKSRKEIDICRNCSEGTKVFA